MNILLKKTKETRYGVTERKKAELDLLNDLVLDAQLDVNQLQAVVTSLTEKSQKFQAFLNSADTSRATALSNKVLIETVVQNALSLAQNSEIAFSEMVLADARSKDLSVAANSLINRLIYTAEFINKLSNFVIRKKALNPLISDELINVINSAGKDANNAVALMLVALNSVIASQATALESEASLTLEYTESMKLYQSLTGTKPDGSHASDYDKSILALLIKSYESAQEHYVETQTANNDTIQQLFNSTNDLNKAQVKLKSLQSALAAANAAAFAS